MSVHAIGNGGEGGLKPVEPSEDLKKKKNNNNNNNNNNNHNHFTS